MPKLSEDFKAQLHAATHHPVQWMRGDGLPEERIRPWEQAVHIVPNIVTGLRNGFTQNTMYLFQNVFGIDKRMQTYASVIPGIFDGANDPVIGAFMDTKNYSVKIHRWIMRVNTVLQTFLRLLPMFDLGFTPWQRIVLFIAIRCFGSLFSTPATVSGAKVWAHITPHSKERARISWASGLGAAIHEMVLPLYLVFIGLREVFGWSEYNIWIFGAVLLSIPSVFLELGPSFVLQRVPDMTNPPAAARGVRGFFRELGECFSVVRHNRYFMLDLAARFITVFSPGISDNDFYRYCGVDEVLKTGKIKGEFLLWFRDNIVSAPCNLIVPFALPIIKKVGGPRNMQVLYQGISTACKTLKWAVGMRSSFGVLFSWTMEMFDRTLGRVQGIAENINKYEMLDYVEWKTGRRSEGVNMAVDGLMRKIVLNNVDTAIGNLVIDRLGFKPKAETQPAAFMKWAPTLYLAVPAFDTFIYFLARLLYKYPAEMRDQVEADLIERRALAQAKQAEVEAAV
ncbi:MAG: MFS transporter [Oscillospiraceae bacterium]|jgi:Na+/melibiose symporter-like transporter|nr:MFS transporter [Oscillospiraceae bacterium]